MEQKPLTVYHSTYEPLKFSLSQLPNAICLTEDAQHRSKPQTTAAMLDVPGQTQTMRLHNADTKVTLSATLSVMLALTLLPGVLNCRMWSMKACGRSETYHLNTQLTQEPIQELQVSR